MKSTFVMEKKVGTEWIALPAEIVGGDANGTYVSIMKRFSGMVFDTLRPGLYRMHSREFQLPNGDIATFGMTLLNSKDFLMPTRLCIGMIMLGDETILNDGEYKTNTIIYTDNISISTFESHFTIINGKISNYKFISNSECLDMQNLHLESNSKCLPAIFAIEDSEEFKKSFIEDNKYKNFLLNNSIPAKWVIPIDMKIKFTVNKEGTIEFKMPNEFIANVGSEITLPDFASLYINLPPLGWQIDNTTYPLGSKFIVPAHYVTAELIYEDKKYSGITT